MTVTIAIALVMGGIFVGTTTGAAARTVVSKGHAARMVVSKGHAERTVAPRGHTARTVVKGGGARVLLLQRQPQRWQVALLSGEASDRPASESWLPTRLAGLTLGGVRWTRMHHLLVMFWLPSQRVSRHRFLSSH